MAHITLNDSFFQTTFWCVSAYQGSRVWTCSVKTSGSFALIKEQSFSEDINWHPRSKQGQICAKSAHSAPDLQGGRHEREDSSPVTIVFSWWSVSCRCVFKSFTSSLAWFNSATLSNLTRWQDIKTKRGMPAAFSAQLMCFYPPGPDHVCWASSLFAEPQGTVRFKGWWFYKQSQAGLLFCGRKQRSRSRPLQTELVERGSKSAFKVLLRVRKVKKRATGAWHSAQRGNQNHLALAYKCQKGLNKWLGAY